MIRLRSIARLFMIELKNESITAVKELLITILDFK